MLADVAQARRAEHGVGHRMTDDVGVGVAEGAAIRMAIVTPPITSGRPGTSRWRSYPFPPVRSAPAGRRGRVRAVSAIASATTEILGAGDLDVRRLAFDQPDRMAGALGQRGFVGGVSADAERLAQDLASKRLRRLGQKNRLARQRSTHEVGRQPIGGPSRAFTVSRAGNAASAAPDSRPPRRWSCAMRPALAKGRAASWTTTMSLSLGARAETRVATESCRRAAARDHPQRLGGLHGDTRAARPRRRAGSATITSSTSGCERNAETLRSRIGRPATSAAAWAAPRRAARRVRRPQ